MAEYLIDYTQTPVAVEFTSTEVERTEKPEAAEGPYEEKTPMFMRCLTYVRHGAVVLRRPQTLSRRLDR